MAREKREMSPTGIYHILLRGIDELFSEKADFKEFIHILDMSFADIDAKLLGYALMQNRVHLIIYEGISGISAIMKPICTRYARYYNRVHDIQGKLFYDRYKSEPIVNDDDLQKVKAFLNSIPSEFKGGVEGAERVDELSCIDDYYRMTDEELKEYIENVFECKISELDTEKRTGLAEKILAGKRISAGRIYMIFKIKKQPAPKKAAVRKKPESKSNEPKKEENNKSGLSVWLL